MDIVSANRKRNFAGRILVASVLSCFYFHVQLIMSDLDPDPVVQLNPQTSSNVNVENPQTHSISG
ncbi:hypothetical protein CUMW_167670, partial [Citrus unshiu]